MRPEGHLGVSLLVIFGAASLLEVYNERILILGLLAAAYSTFPDLDMSFEVKHRGITHNILFALVSGVLLGLLFEAGLFGFTFLEGFIAGFLGVTLHILGDLLTPMKFQPLWPFSKKRVSLGIVRSRNRVVNTLLYIVGMMVLARYAMELYNIGLG